MNILYIAHGGFGDVSFTTVWPKVWTLQGHVVDVFLMQHTGNPFHENPFVRKTFVYPCAECPERIKSLVRGSKYDKIITLENDNTALKGVLEVIRPLEESLIAPSKKAPVRRKFNIKKIGWIPPQWFPQFYFSKDELQCIQNRSLRDSALFYPLSSSHDEESRNISFSLTKKCANDLPNVVVAHGGREFKNSSLKMLEKSKVKLFWEGFNAESTDRVKMIGMLLALTSTCRVGIHGWSGSILMSVGFNKPFVVVVPGEVLRNNKGAPYLNTKDQFNVIVRKLFRLGYEQPHAWCITEKASDILDAVEIVLSGRKAFFHKTWMFFEGGEIK